MNEIYLNRTLKTFGNILFLNKKDEAPIRILYENNTIIFIIDNNISLEFKGYLNWNVFVNTILQKPINDLEMKNYRYCHHIDLRDLITKEQIELLVFTFKDFSLLKFDKGVLFDKNFLIDGKIIEDLKIPYESK